MIDVWLTGGLVKGLNSKCS